MRSPIRPLFAALALALAGIALPSPAAATNHIVQIDEVMAGAFGRSDIQFVELKFSDCSQTSWSGVARLAFYDAQGNQVAQFPFPVNPPANCAIFGQSVLIGTQAFKDLASAPDPDFLIAPSFIPSSGKVCFRDGPSVNFPVTLCLSYGDFTGASEQGSPSNAPALGTREVCALQRTAFFTSFGSNFNADFGLRAPAPRNNAGTTGTVVVPPRFLDVPADHAFFRFIEAMA